MVGGSVVDSWSWKEILSCSLWKNSQFGRRGTFVQIINFFLDIVKYPGVFPAQWGCV